MTYSKSRYIGLCSCGSLGPTACGRYCGATYKCSGSGSQTYWGAYPHFNRCGTSCHDQTALPKQSGCGSTFFAGACKETFQVGGSVRSCGPSNGLTRTHPSKSLGGNQLQACSPTGSEYQVCSINIGWATDAFLHTTSPHDVGYPYFWGKVIAA